MNNNWTTKKLAEITKEIYRYPTYYNIRYTDIGVLEIRGEMIKDDGEIDSKLARLISEKTAEKFPKTKLDLGDIVLSVRGTIGKIGIVSKELIGGNITANLMRISPDHTFVLPYYLWHYLRSPFFKNELSRISSNTTINTIKAPDLKNINIPVPSLGIQKQIVERMDKISEAQKLNDELIQKADELFQSLLYREFKLRNKDSELKSLRGLVELASGKTRPKEMTQDKTQIPVYGGNGIMGYSSNFLFQNDTIAIGRVGYYCGSVHFVNGHSWITDNAIYIRSYKGVNIEYLYYFLLTQHLNKFAGYSGQPKITQEPILNLKIFVPEVHLQKQIVAKLSAVQEYKKQLLEQKSKLKELFDSVLHRSMNGGFVS